MSQWAEVRHLHLVEGVSKKEIARRLLLDVKTVRRALEQPTPMVPVSPPRVRSLDPWREQIAQWLDQDRRLTAKRIRRLLLPLAGPVAARTVRRYVATLRAATAPKVGYVHHSVPASGARPQVRLAHPAERPSGAQHDRPVHAGPGSYRLPVRWTGAVVPDRQDASRLRAHRPERGRLQAPGKRSDRAGAQAAPRESDHASGHRQDSRVA